MGHLPRWRGGVLLVLYRRAVDLQTPRVDVMTFRAGRVQEEPRSVGFRPPLILETAIERSQGYLLREQKPEGYWVGELMVDSTLVSDTIAYHHWNGKIDAAWQRKAVNHIFSMQLPDGGWNIYNG